MKKLEKIIKFTDASLETKAKFIHIIVFPITMYGCESWTVKKVSREKSICSKYDDGGEFCGHFGKTNKWVLDQIKPDLSLWKHK